MPTVHREGGFIFKIHLNDHEPAHVHARLGGGEVVIVLGSGEAEPYEREARGMKDQEIRRALDITRRRQAVLLEAWRECHGRS